MKKIRSILLILVMLSVIALAGCSSERLNIRQGPRDRMPEGNRQLGAGMQNNLSENEMQQMFEERQQMAIQACDGKNEGDSCQFEGRMGDATGICKILDENLVCMLDRLMGPRKE